MSREIKFRAWHKVKKEMVHLREMSAGCAQGGHVYFGCEEYGHQYYEDLDDADWELMQDTGLKDKNGIDIYEGDIVTANNKDKFRWEHKGVVEFVPLTVSYAINTGKELIENDEDFFAWFHYVENIEVIGNVFENANLLKV